jgi:hypothetical protein
MIIYLILIINKKKNKVMIISIINSILKINKKNNIFRRILIINLIIKINKVKKNIVTRKKK